MSPITSKEAGRAGNFEKAKVSFLETKVSFTSKAALAQIDRGRWQRPRTFHRAADGAIQWRTLGFRQECREGRSTWPGRRRLVVRPVPIAAPAGFARWAVPCWPTLSWPPAPSLFRHSANALAIALFDCAG